MLLGSKTFGIVILNIIQVILSLTIFSLMIKYLNKLKIPSWLLLIFILFIGLNPIITTHVTSLLKDNPSAIFNLLYIILQLQIVINYNSVFGRKSRIVLLIVTMLLVMMFRNNGIYTIVLSFPLVMFLYRDKIKQFLIVFLIPLVSFGIYDKVLLPSFDISGGSIRETLSVPVMQLSRLAKYQEDAFSKKDINTINKVFDFDLMKSMYDPSISDNIKNTFNKDCTKEELFDFFKVWFKYLVKYPNIYVESFVNNTYGYFYPVEKSDYLYLYNFKTHKTDFYDEVYTFEELSSGRKTMNSILSIFYTKLNIFTSAWFYDLLLIFTSIYLIKKKRYKYLIPLSPLLITLLVCLASPLNGSVRYILPIIYSLPIIVSIIYLNLDDKNNFTKNSKIS